MTLITCLFFALVWFVLLCILSVEGCGLPKVLIRVCLWFRNKHSFWEQNPLYYSSNWVQSYQDFQPMHTSKCENDIFKTILLNPKQAQSTTPYSPVSQLGRDYKGRRVVIVWSFWLCILLYIMHPSVFLVLNFFVKWLWEHI